MGKGSYLGGGTLFTFADLNWFGAGGHEVPREERVRRIKHELLRQSRLELSASASARQRELHELLQYGMWRDHLAEQLADLPNPAPQRKLLDRRAEQRIADLKRDLAAHENKVRSAIAAHEALRQKLLSMLAEYHLSEDQYPEARKLTL